MPLKVTQENLDDVPEGLHEFYKETDGGFVLEVDGIDSHPDVSNLRNAYQRVKESDKTARQKLQELQDATPELPEDFDPKLWEKAKNGDLQSGGVEARKQLESELAQERERAGKLEKSLQGLTVDRALSDALDAANITAPAYRKAATAMLRDAVKLEGDEVIVESDMGPLNPSEYVKKWASTDEGKPFVSQPSGGGSRSGNPGVTKGPKDWSEAKTLDEKAAFLAAKRGG